MAGIKDAKLEVVLSLKDGLTGGLVRARKQLNDFAGAVSGMAAPFGRLTSLIGGIGNVATTAFGAVVGAVKSVVSWVGRAVEKLMAFAKWGLIIGTVTLTAIAKSSIDAALQMEGFMAKLTTATKSKAMGKQWMDWAIDFAAGTPFEMSEVVDSATRLLLQGFNPQALLTDIGNMAGAMNKPLADAVEAYLDAQRGEFERIKEFGISGANLIKYGANPSAQGGVASQSAEDQAALQGALAGIMRDRYGGGMAQMMKTGAGQISNFKDAVYKLKVTIGEALMPTLKAAVEWGQKFVTWLKDSGLAERFGRGLAVLAGGLFNLASKALPLLVNWMMRLSDTSLWDWAQNAAATVGAWLGKLSEWVGVNIKIIGAWLRYFVDYGKYLVAWAWKHIPDLLDVFVTCFAGITDAIFGVMSVANALKGVFGEVFNFIKMAVAASVASIALSLQLVTGMLAQLLGGLAKIPGVGGMFKGAAASMKQAHNYFGALRQSATEEMMGAAGNIGQSMKAALDENEEIERRKAQAAAQAAAMRGWAGRVRTQWGSVPEPTAPTMPSDQFAPFRAPGAGDTANARAAMFPPAAVGGDVNVSGVVDPMAAAKEVMKLIDEQYRRQLRYAPL